MNWTDLIQSKIETTYSVTEGLIDLVDDDMLDWKPTTGSNWMTVAQLVHHLTDACGTAMRGFVTGDWGMPPEGEMTPDEMLPPATTLPAVSSLTEAKQMLAQDKQLALEMLAQCSEDQLAHRQVTAPWNPASQILGHALLDMVGHLGQHKSQLFYYLKLQGKPVNTGNLWGM
jgi:DinB family protein